MTKLQLINKPTKISDLGFDDLHYEETYDDWRERAERLQARRWHLLREAIKHAGNKEHKGGVV